jgi:16S rRNA (cytosine1402-N4)-methyltransferase
LHEPVLVREVVEGLALRPGDIAVDLTAGSGGHAVQLLEAVGSRGQLIAIDRDPDAIKRCQDRLRSLAGGQANERGGVRIERASFAELGRVLSQLHVAKVHAVLMDLGVSREQLETPERGFSFMRDGPLDMRMDPNLSFSAADVIGSLPENELADVFWRYGEEHRSRRVARFICRERERCRIDTTKKLADLVSKTLHRRGRIHPATKVFQALRIYVNNELKVLETALATALDCLFPKGRLAVITYHSLEDRIVKHFFRQEKENNRITWVNKKPVVAAREEIGRNASARSAKLRIVERL